MSGAHPHAHGPSSRPPIPFAPVSLLMRLEGAAVAAAAALVFLMAGFAWWWLLVVFLLFDLGFLGYVVSNRVGAATYNGMHNYVVPVALLAVWAIAGANGLDLGALAFVGASWLFHVGVDRAVGFGPRPAA